MNIVIDKRTKETGQDKLKKTLSFFEGKFIRNQETNFDVALITTIENHVINSDKYRASIYNRVDALKNFAVDSNLQLLFITCTLPSQYHKYKMVDNVPVKNKNFAYKNLEMYDIFTKRRAASFTKFLLKYYKTLKRIKWTGKVEKVSLSEDDYSVHNGYKRLIKMFSDIRKDRSWAKIEKNLRLFFSVIEPTKNLTAHIHIVIWVPMDNVANLIETFFRFNPYPTTHIYTKQIPKSLHKKYKRGLVKSNNDIINYALKYLNNLMNEDDEVSNLSLWYLAHKITPFSSSRSFIPQDIYKKLGGRNTLYDATKNYYTNAIYAWNNVNTKKLMKVFVQDDIIWTKQPYTLHTNLHPVGSSNSDTKDLEWED